MLKRDSELQQKESALLAVQQELEEMRQRAEETEAALRSERDAFEEAKKCLNDNLNQVQTALEEAEARDQESIADCQHALKVFKFKKYKEGYEDRERGVCRRYPLKTEFSLGSEGQDPLENSAAPATVEETSLYAPSK